MTHKIDLDELRALHEKGLTLTSIASHYGCTIKVITKRLQSIGLTWNKTNKKLAGMDEQIVSEYASGKTTSEIGRAYGVSNVTIINILEKAGKKRRLDSNRRYDCDHSFFEVIDTEQKAYVLGLLYADGCNHGNRISLSLSDGDLVSDVGRLFSNYPVHLRSNPTPVYSIQIYSAKMANDLRDHGCPPRKTWVLCFPSETTVPPQLIRHFVRGYFDGDGCIHVRKNSQNRVIHILGTKEFCEGLANALPVNAFVRKRSNSEIWYVGIYKSADIKEFGRWLYDDSSIYLSRKKDKFNLS